MGEGSQIVGGLIAGGAALVYAIYRLQVFRAVVGGSREKTTRTKDELTQALHRRRAIDLEADEFRLRTESRRAMVPVSFRLTKTLEGADDPDTPDNYAVILVENDGGKCVGASAQSPVCEVHIDPPDFGPRDPVHITFTGITSRIDKPVAVTLGYTNAAGAHATHHFDYHRATATLHNG